MKYFLVFSGIFVGSLIVGYLHGAGKALGFNDWKNRRK